jgi:hypothetical protein
MKNKTYTKTPVTIEARKVPKIANVTIAPKFEKKGFCKKPHYHKVKRPLQKNKKQQLYKREKTMQILTGARLKPD